MNLIYITGTSSGLGKALAKLLLEDNSNQVVGVARRETIQHERYTHFNLDLKETINKNIFEKLPLNCEKVLLINNAGAIGPITKVGSQSYEEVADNYIVNITAPSFLCNQFVQAYQNEKVQKIIINVSSVSYTHLTLPTKA